MTAVLFLLSLLLAPAAYADDADDAKRAQQANNPLAQFVGFNLQDYYAPSLTEVSGTANTFYLRAVAPFWRVLPRVTLPVMSVNGPGAGINGLGDLQIFAAFLVTNPDSHLQFGIGPQYTAPTATQTAFGSGWHQIGATATVVWFEGPLMLGALLQFQAGVAGDDTRERPYSFVPQIFAMFQLGKGFYLRSTPAAQFNLQNGEYVVPFGVGVGKVIPYGKTMFNLFIEPQPTVLYNGPAKPGFQVFMGLNIQYSP